MFVCFYILVLGLCGIGCFGVRFLFCWFYVSRGVDFDGFRLRGVFREDGIGFRDAR